MCKRGSIKEQAVIMNYTKLKLNWDKDGIDSQSLIYFGKSMSFPIRVLFKLKIQICIFVKPSTTHELDFLLDKFFNLTNSVF